MAGEDGGSEAAAGQRFKLGRMGLSRMEGGRLARRIYEETNSCSLLEFYAGELPNTEHDSHPPIPGPFPVHSPSFLAIS